MTSEENATPSTDSGAAGPEPVVKKISPSPAKPAPAGGIKPIRPGLKQPVRPGAVGSRLKKPASVGGRSPGVIPGQKIVSPMSAAAKPAEPVEQAKQAEPVEPQEDAVKPDDTDAEVDATDTDAESAEAVEPAGAAKSGVVMGKKKVVKTSPSLASAAAKAREMAAKQKSAGAGVVKGKKKKAATGLAAAAAKAREMSAKQKTAAAGGVKTPEPSSRTSVKRKVAPGKSASVGQAQSPAPAVAAVPRCAWATFLLVLSFLLSAACVGVLSLNVMDAKVMAGVREQIGSVAVMVRDIKVGPEDQDAGMTNFLAQMTADIEAKQKALASAKAAMGGAVMAPVSEEPVSEEPVSMESESLTTELPTPPDPSDLSSARSIEPDVTSVVEEPDTSLESVVEDEPEVVTEEVPSVSTEEATDDVASLLESNDSQPADTTSTEASSKSMAPVESVEADITGDLEGLLSGDDGATAAEEPKKEEKKSEKSSTSEEEVLDLDALLAE